MIDGGYTHLSSTRYSNKINIYNNKMHLDNSINKLCLDKYNNKNNTTTQQQSNITLVQYFYVLQDFTATTPGLNNLIICK